jgi:sulfonate transport system substrate-binding protein
MIRTRRLALAAGVVLAAVPAVYMVLASPRGAEALGLVGVRQDGLALSAPLPDAIPPGVTLAIGDPMTEAVMKHEGWRAPFAIKWARITGGPAVTEAFHARVLDVGLSADIPPIHAVWVGMPVKTIAVMFRADAAHHPLYELAVAPGSGVTSLADLRGKRIAFSPGQVQGEVVLRTLEAQGLDKNDVTLVELPSTSADVYINALVGGLVDVAPLAPGAATRHYVADWGAKGARLIAHGPFRDDLTNLYVRDETLRDPAKAAALHAYVQLWARAAAWIDAHPAEWAQLYYVEEEGLSADDARYVVEAAGSHEVPRDWTGAIALQQGAINLMASETGQRRFDAHQIFDRRFEPVAAGAWARASAGERLAQR